MGGRDESRKRAVHLKRSRERQRWREEEAAFNIEMKEENEIMGKNLKRINLLKAELKREEQQFSILFQHDLQSALQLGNIDEVDNQITNAASKKNDSNFSAESGMSKIDESVSTGTKT